MNALDKDIQDFLYYMIHSKSLTREQQTKRDKLLVRDLSTGFKIGKEVQSANGNKERICTIHNPIEVVSFLHKFSENNNALKYTTHFWDKDKDDNYNYPSFEYFKSTYMSSLNNGDFNLSLMFGYNEHLWKLIRNFLVLDEPISNYTWSEYKLCIGYNKYVKAWMDSNPGLQPANMPITAFPKEFQPKGLIKGKVLSYFSDIIEIFKHCIEFRDTDFLLCVTRLFKNSDYHVVKNGLENMQGVFTDTELVKEALSIIAGNLRPMYPDVEINCSSYTLDGAKVVEVRILQKGSFSNRNIDDGKIKAVPGEGDFYRIKGKLLNLCDFAVESNFKIGDDLRHCRINYLSSDINKEDIVFIDDKECEGFTYVLTFYVL